VEIQRVALRVSDLDRSIEFYERIGGLDTREREDERVTLGAPDGGPARLELRVAKRPGTAARRTAGLFHTALRYPTREQLGAALRRIAVERYPLSGASDHLVSEALYLDDPDGLGVELYRDRPRGEWPPPRPGEKVHMDTIPLNLDSLLQASSAEMPGASAGVDIGHVHLKVADVKDAVAFWTGEPGLELMTMFGDDAAFLAADGYHHHIGANSWFSRGAPLDPPDVPGIAEVVLARDGVEADLRTPDGVRVVLAPTQAS
jgi:catechol 2,3-dioxygenase